MTTHDRSSGFAARPRAIEGWIRTPDPTSSSNVVADLYTARLTVDIKPAFRGRTKIATFEHGVTVAEMLRDLLTRELSDTDGGCS